MSFVNPKQQRLIDLSVDNHINFYDKFTGQYLGLRKQIYQLNRKLVDGDVSDDSKMEVFKLRLQLDTLVESYKVHIKQLIALLDTSRVKQPFQDEINQQLTEIKTKQSIITQEIYDIRKVQKPTLDKIEKHLQLFHNNLDNKSNINPHKLKKNGLEDMLVFEEKDIKNMFQDSKLKDYVESILKNGKFLERLNDGQYFYRLNRSTLHDVDSHTTTVQYDKLIHSCLAGIDNLLAEGDQIKSKWNSNANKILEMKLILDKYDEPEAMEE